MKGEKHLEVRALENGTVIDHIPADALFKVISILDLDKITNQITFGTNLQSSKFGTKAIVKISDTFFEQDDINRIALVAPQAKLNIIKNYHVIEKKEVVIPDKISGIVKCMNPMCITNNEPVKTKFQVVSKNKLALKCHYCEKITDEDNLEIIH